MTPWVNTAAYAVTGALALFIFLLFVRIGRTVIALTSETMEDWLEETLDAAPGMVKILILIIGLIFIFLIVVFVIFLIVDNISSLLTLSYWIVATLSRIFGSAVAAIPRK